MSELSKKIKVLFLINDEKSIIEPLLNLSTFDITVIQEPDKFEFKNPFPDIVVCVSDWRYSIAKLVFKARENAIPTLLLQDGTLDWIIQNEGNLYGGNGGATHYAPVLTDKIAVIGHQSARYIANWSSSKQVEIVGFPKLEKIISDSNSFKLNQNKPEDNATIRRKKVLVTSPRQGWYSEFHKINVLDALNDLKEYFEETKFEVTWRLSRNLSDLIGVSNTLKNKESEELSELIKKSDLVISFQSTVVLESMLYGKPVAIIDYTNSPQYYNTAWFISHRDQIDEVVNSMLNPSKLKMQFQEYQLNDILYKKSSSIERLSLLIEKMVHFVRQNNSLDFPENLLDYCMFSFHESKISKADLYPRVSEFRITTITDKESHGSE